MKKGSLGISPGLFFFAVKTSCGIFFYFLMIFKWNMKLTLKEGFYIILLVCESLSKYIKKKNVSTLGGKYVEKEYI